MKTDVLTALGKKAEDNNRIKLSGLSNLLDESEITVIKEISVNKLLENANHPFKIIDNEEMAMLVESIKKEGQIEPIVVRPKNGGFYEILAGHRRSKAHKILGMKSIKAIVGNFDDEKANRILINSNFNQRKIIYPSEVARSYKLRYEDLKKQRKAQNSDGRNFESERKIDEILAEEFHMSKSSIYMYLHFNCLIKEFLDLLDEKKLKQKVADELSYLREDEQQSVFEIVFRDKLCGIDKTKAALLRAESNKENLNKEHIKRLILPVEKSKINYKYFSNGQLDKYLIKFAEPKDMEKAIIEFLESYIPKANENTKLEGDD